MDGARWASPAGFSTLLEPETIIKDWQDEQAGFAQQESEARRWSALAGCWGVGRRPRVRPVLCRVTIS